MRELWTNEWIAPVVVPGRVKLPRPEVAIADRVRAELRRQGRRVSEEALMLAVSEAVEDAVSSLRVAIRTERPLEGVYRTATESDEISSFERRCQPGEAHYAREVVALRRQYEERLGLWMDGRAPVSGVAVLSSPPGLRGAVIRWRGSVADNSQLYGPFMNILSPDVLERSLFWLGDTFNLMGGGHLHDLGLEHLDAAFLTATQGTHPHVHPQDLRGDDEVEYIEALVFGGISGDDVEAFVHCGVEDAPSLRGTHNLGGHCYLTWRSLQLLE